MFQCSAWEALSIFSTAKVARKIDKVKAKTEPQHNRFARGLDPGPMLEGDMSNPPRKRKTAYSSLRGICRRLGVPFVVGRKKRDGLVFTGDHPHRDMADGRNTDSPTSALQSGGDSSRHLNQ
jgi:hypothetical protein